VSRAGFMRRVLTYEMASRMPRKTAIKRSVFFTGGGLYGAQP
jgi:hypothetical protein